MIASKDYAVVVGGANMDVCGKSSQKIIERESNPGTLTLSPGGVGRNIAENLSRLGSCVKFIGAWGDDDWGHTLQRACEAAGVCTESCLIVPGATSSHYLSIHQPDGEMVVALNDMKIIHYLDEHALAERENILTQSKLLVLDANLTEPALDYVFAQINHSTMMVDPVSSIKAKKLMPFLNKIHTLKPNRLEAQLLSGIAINREKDLRDAANVLHQKGVRRLLISLGAEGAFSSDGIKMKRWSVHATEANNVTGAGDALMAALAHSEMKGASWHDGVRFALAAAHLAVMSQQTIDASLSEDAVNHIMETYAAC